MKKQVICIALTLLCSACSNKASGFASLVCARVEIQYGQACNSVSIINTYPDAIQNCLPKGEFVASDSNLDLAILCLESEGVDLIREITP